MAPSGAIPQPPRAREPAWRHNGSGRPLHISAVQSSQSGHPRAHSLARRHSGLHMAPRWCHDGVMDLTPYVDALRRELAVAAEAGGEDARELAERLTAPLE